MIDLSEDDSFFPVLLKYADRDFIEVVKEPKDLRLGISFKIININHQGETIDDKCAG